MEFHDEHPFILRDPNKCILCGLCVRACDEVMGVGALGLVKRGFDTVVMPALEQPLTETGCISCGQCASVCPTGALQENLSLEKICSAGYRRYRYYLLLLFCWMFYASGNIRRYACKSYA